MPENRTVATVTNHQQREEALRHKLKLLLQLITINMAMAPDREAFLRKLEENKAPSPSPSFEANDDTLRFLREAGLDPSTLIDPASLAVLQRMVSSKKNRPEEEESKPAAAASDAVPDAGTVPDLVEQPVEYQTTLKTAPAPAPAPLSEVRTNREFRYMTSEITLTEMQSVTETNATTAGSVGGAAPMSSEQLILQQLELQTQMIMDMQRRMDHLTNMVYHMSGAPSEGSRERAAQPFTSPSHRGPPSMIPAPPAPPLGPRITPHWQGAPPHVAAAAARDVAAPPPAVVEPPPHTLFTSVCDYVRNIPVRVRASRTAEVWRVFWALHQRYVRLDGGLLFKVLMAIALFSAKLMSRRNKKGDFWSPTLKFNLVVSMVFLGFCIQSGYFTLFYRFFFKEDLVHRIYAGETIDVEQINWRNNNNQNNAARGGAAAAINLRNLIPRNNFMGGNIPAPRDGVNILTDIVVLFGSFILSILPMWKPEGEPDRRQQQQQQQQPGAAQPEPAVAGPRQGPNEVAPPPDLDQHAADDTDTDDEENDDAHQD